MAPADIRIADAANAADLEAVRTLLTRYAEEQGFKLCFQGFDRELAGLPGDYAEPKGCLLLARTGGAAAGVVALRPLGVGAVELKRLYVRPADRGTGLGRQLAEAAVARADQGLSRDGAGDFGQHGPGARPLRGARFPLARPRSGRHRTLRARALSGLPGRLAGPGQTG